MIRSYRIEDEGDEIHLAMFEDDFQVGSGLFPDDGTGKAFELAYEIGEEFVGEPIPRKSIIAQMLGNHYGGMGA